MESAIQQRYKNKAAASSLGCANLTQFWSIEKGSRVLDLGCGRGQTAYRLAELTGPAGQVFGLDLTPEMIEVARSGNTFPNIDFRCGDIHSLPYPDDAMDAVLSNCVINHAHSKEQVYREIFRVLKPGGYFLVGDVTAVERLPEDVSSDPDNVAACWGGALPKDEYLAIIRQTGFTDIGELSSRRYRKHGYELESIIVKGVKP